MSAGQRTGDDAGQGALAGQAILLQYAVIAYNLLEAVASLIAGLMAGSIALVGFGLDGAVEISASAAVLVHLKRNARSEGSVWEQRVASSWGYLLVLAFIIWNEAVLKIATQSRPDASLFGVGVAAGVAGDYAEGVTGWRPTWRASCTVRRWRRRRARRWSAPGCRPRSSLASAPTRLRPLVGRPGGGNGDDGAIGREGWLAIKGRDLLHQHHDTKTRAARSACSQGGAAPDRVAILR